MHRLVGLSALGLCAFLAAGCAASHARLAGVHVGDRPPAWLTTIASQEDKRFNDRGDGSLSIKFSKRRYVVEMFGEFTTPPPAACTTSYCPVPVRLHGTFLRLVISPRTHRILSATISRRIDGTQAIAVARHSSPVLRIFPARPGRASCAIPRGAHVGGTFSGRCVTELAAATRASRRAGAVRILFGERWGREGPAQRAAWVVTVRYSDGRVLSTQATGQPPQLWK